MSICKNCILPDTYPGIHFEDGLCDFCRNHENLPKVNSNLLGRDNFLKMLLSEKRGEYNCIVPLSGGKDSSYILYYVVKNLNLKPLAVFFDNHFIVDYAKNNVKEICKRLNVDLVVGQASHFRREIVKEALYLSKYLGKITKTCANCENNLRSFMINEATKRDIPFIIWGSTDVEDGSKQFTEFSGTSYRETYGTIASMFQRIKNAIRASKSSMDFSDKCRYISHAIKYMYYFIHDNVTMKAPEGIKKYNPFLEVSFKNKGVQVIYFYDYIEYNPYKMIKILKNEVGWKAPSKKESRMDCKLHSLSNYQHLRNMGITADGFTLSIVVRNGMLSREEAIEKEEILKKDLQKECQEVCNELGVNYTLPPIE